MKQILFALFAGLICGPLGAEENAAIQRYGDTVPNCREWTDGCRVCARTNKEPVSCSLSGIACEPRAVTCTAPSPSRP